MDLFQQILQFLSSKSTTVTITCHLRMVNVMGVHVSKRSGAQQAVSYRLNTVYLGNLGTNSPCVSTLPSTCNISTFCSTTMEVRVQDGQFYTSTPLGLPRQLTPVSQLSIWALLSPPRQGSYLISHRSISGSLISHSASEKWILFSSSHRGVRILTGSRQEPDGGIS